MAVPTETDRRPRPGESRWIVAVAVVLCAVMVGDAVAQQIGAEPAPVALRNFWAAALMLIVAESLEGRPAAVVLAVRGAAGLTLVSALVALVGTWVG